MKANKNPLADKKWLKEFAEEFKKDVKHSKKSSSGGWTREKEGVHSELSQIVCTQKDIGEPVYFQKRKAKK